MKHLFTLLAAISFLICLFLVAVTVMTWNGSQTIGLGERGERTYSLGVDSLEFTYQAKIAPFDMSSKQEKMGIEYTTLNRAKTNALPEATGFVLVVPALYPIALFAILPAVWLLGAMRRKKAPIAADAAESGPTPVRRA